MLACEAASALIPEDASGAADSGNCNLIFGYVGYPGTQSLVLEERRGRASTLWSQTEGTEHQWRHEEGITRNEGLVYALTCLEKPIRIVQAAHKYSEVFTDYYFEIFFLRRATKLMTDLEHKSYEEWLR